MLYFPVPKRIYAMFRRILPSDARVAIPNTQRRVAFTLSHLEVQMFNEIVPRSRTFHTIAPG